MDLLNVVIRADTTGADRADTSLQKMSASARMADAAMAALGRGSGSASARMAEAAQRSARAIDEQAQALRRLAAANDNAAGSTANIAAQFQDIGVTAAMGMNPIMIALQQGTQLSAVLNTMQNPLKGLAVAFMSIINPVSLLTIGFVALGAAAIQWFTSSQESAQGAERALERHGEWLNKILAGYDGMREAARLAGEEAARLPDAIVRLELQAGLKEQAEQAEILGFNILQTRESIAATARFLREIEASGQMAGEGAGNFGKYAEQVEFLEKLSLSAKSTQQELESAAIAAKELWDSSDEPTIQQMADDVYKLAQQLMFLRAQSEETRAALDYGFQDLSGMQAWSQITAELTDWNHQLARAADASAWAIRNSGDAAVVAASQYGTATGAANAYANALFALGSLIPQVAAQQAAMADMGRAEQAFTNAETAAGDLLRLGAINRAEYNERIAETATRYDQAKDAISGVSALEEQLASQTAQNSIAALTGREQALAQVNQQYAEQAKQIEGLSLAAPAERAALLAQNNEQLAVALANTNAQFDQTAAASGGAAKALKAAEKDFNSFISTADKLAEALFPGEYARREAEELQALLEQHGQALDDFQRQAVQAEIGDLFAASEIGVRRLEATTKDAARNMADALQETLGSVLSDLFSSPIEDFDDLMNRVMSGLGQMGQANLSASMDMLFGNTDGLAKAVERGAARGTEAGASGGIFDGLSNILGGGANGNALANGLGAGLGGLGIGYQTQSPIMGAVGGALSGMSAGPIGMVLGGIGGFIGGLFGMNQALEEAKDKLNTARGAIDSLLDVGEGRGVGQMAQAFRDFWDKSHEYQALAAKAQDGALQKRLQDAVNTFFLQLDKDFRLGFEGTLDALSSGQGMGGAFVSAQQQIVGLREELKAFVADTEFMGNKLGELAGIDNGAQVAEDLARARRSAQDFALSVLSGAEELTEMEKKVAEAEGRASGLQVTLEQLGMSAGDAANAISGALNTALAKLRDEYLGDLNTSINELSGFGFLNEIIDAQSKYQERLRDGAALGIDGSLALQELNLSLAGVVKSAGLSQAQIDMLATAFPLMSSLIETLAGQGAMQSVADAEAALRSSYEAQRSEIDQTISRLERFGQSIRKVREDMRFDASSPLGQQQQAEDAMRLFRETAALAAGGDQGAQDRLVDISQTARDEAREYHASSAAYAAIWTEIDQTLAGIEGQAGRQLSEAQRQREALDRQIGALISIDQSVLSVGAAIAGLTAAMGARDAALQAQIMATQSQGSNQVQDFYKSILGRTGSASEIGWWTSSGKSMAQIEADLIWAKQHGAMAMGGIVGAYAGGGMVGNGLWNVDSVLARYAGGGNIALAGGEHVTRATSVNPATRPVLDHINRLGSVPGNDNSEVVAELRSLRQDSQQLIAAVSKLAQLVGLSDEETRKLLREGNADVADLAGELKRANSGR